MDFKHVTTEEAVVTYNATRSIFAGILREVRELSRKKPDATLSQGKVKLINRVLADLRDVLEKEPEYKFLDLLDDDNLPQTSDAVLIMVQYESALTSFKDRYHRRAKKGYDTRSGSHGIFPTFCAARMQPEDRMVNERRRPSGRRGDA